MAGSSLQPRRMRILLRFRLGAHSLPVVMGRRSGSSRAQRLSTTVITMLLGRRPPSLMSALHYKCADKTAALLVRPHYVAVPVAGEPRSMGRGTSSKLHILS